VATLRWTSIDELQFRMGALPSDPTGLDVALTGVLAGVERTIETAIRSPVALKLIENEWRAPVTDPKLVTRWRPINVEDEDAGTADPIVLWCNTAYDATTGTALTYGTDYVIYDRAGDDPRFGLAPMLELSTGTWWGWGGAGTNGGGWSGRWVRPPTRLANTLTSDRGRLNLTYWAGWPADAIPQNIVEAAYLEATTLWRMRKYGQLLQSESLNGYSYSLGSPGVVGARQGAQGKFSSDAAAKMLQQYVIPAVAGVSPW